MNMGFSGGFQIGECEPFGFCFLWPTVPISMNKLLSFFFVRESTHHSCECVFSFSRGLTD